MKKQEDKPNILMLFTDDQRFDTIRSLGNSEIYTPNMDELVKDGTAFTHAHIPGGTVGAVCMPSRAMLHTGMTLFHLENCGSTVLEEHALMGETLKRAGYCTYGIGKWHNGPRSYARSFTDGDEIFFGGMEDHWNVPAYNFDPEGKYDNTGMVTLNPWLSNTTMQRRCDHIYPGKHSSELFSEAALKWIDKYQSDKPFFMYVSFMAPHDPRTMPEEFLNMYNPDEITLPDNFMPEHSFDYGVSSIRDELLAPNPRKPDEIRKHICEYYAIITHLDNEIGKIMAALKKKGVYDNTLIIFAGDNGLALGQHGLMGKQSNYEHSIRVPLIFSGPGIPKNKSTDTYVYLLDIFPTLCDILGIDVPKTVEGKSFADILQNKRVTGRETLYMAYKDNVRSVKNEKYKLIEYRTDGLKKTQLFNLNSDPYEMENLYGKPEYQNIYLSLKEEMLRYSYDWDDVNCLQGKKFWGNY